LTVSGELPTILCINNKDVFVKRFTLILIALIAQNSWAWGPQGHMVVAQVADNNLSAPAKKAVAKLLSNQTLSDVANWADSIKSNPDWVHTKPWHFLDLADGEDYATVEHSHDGDVVEAITEMVKALKDQRTTPEEKSNALKFIVHFMGDIHQPLHIGRPDDRGGNDFRVVFEGRKTNLHALWDSIMIMKSPMDHVQYAKWLETNTFVTAPYDIPELTFSSIIGECMDARKSVYDFKDVASPVVLDASYYNKNVGLMNHQLLSGGKRLASLLNSIYR
jgi:hypothetical protein